MNICCCAHNILIYLYKYLNTHNTHTPLPSLDAYEYGKDIAKRSTWFDVLTTVSSDEGLGAFVLRVALQFLLNFTIGLFIAFFSFLWQLWSLVVLYKTSLVRKVVVGYC
jgi:hypothetical protein